MITPPQQSTKKPTQKPGSGNPRKKRRVFGPLLNIILIIGLIAVGYLFYYTEQKRAAAEEELQNTASQLEELRQTAQNSGQQVAAEVINKLRNHIDIPTEPQPTVATITDIDRLRETNEFYAKAKNGDHLIITEQRAILFDADRDIVIDVVPVRINQNATPSPAAEEAEDPNTTPSPGSENSNQTSTQSPTTSPSASPTP